MEASGRRLLGRLGQGTREGIVVLADEVSSRDCLRFCAGRLYRKKVGVHARRQNFISETFHASSSEDSSHRCLEMKAAATAAAGHTIKHRETCSGAAPRHTNKHRETCCGGKSI